MQIKLNKNGREVVFNFKEEEVEFLVEYAVVELLKKGILSVEDKEEDFLKSVKTEDCYKA